MKSLPKWPLKSKKIDKNAKISKPNSLLWKLPKPLSWKRSITKSINSKKNYIKNKNAIKYDLDLSLDWIDPPAGASAQPTATMDSAIESSRNRRGKIEKWIHHSSIHEISWSDSDPIDPGRFTSFSGTTTTLGSSTKWISSEQWDLHSYSPSPADGETAVPPSIWGVYSLDKRRHYSPCCRLFPWKFLRLPPFSVTLIPALNISNNYNNKWKRRCSSTINMIFNSMYRWWMTLFHLLGLGESKRIVSAIHPSTWFFCSSDSLSAGSRPHSATTDRIFLFVAFIRSKFKSWFIRCIQRRGP